MFGWNPFKKPEAAPQQAPEIVSSIAAQALLDEIVRVRNDTLGQDLRIMQRLIRDTEFLLPLLEPIREVEGGVSMKYMTVENDEVMVAFTDPARLREFFGNQNPLGGTQMAVTNVTGQFLCKTAQDSGLRKIILNPNSDILFALPPLVYGAIAHGLVLGHISNDDAMQFPGAVSQSVAGVPNAELMAKFRAACENGGASEAFWCGLELPPDELRFAIGVNAPAEKIDELREKLTEIWILNWPLPSPIHVFAFGDGEKPERDVAFRNGDRIL